MRSGPRQVFGCQTLVEIDRGRNLPHDGGGAGIEPSAPHCVGAHFVIRKTMTKKIIISLTVIVAVVCGVLYGKGLLSVHHGLEPPASLSVLALEKDPKTAPDVHFADAQGNRHALSAFRGRYVLLNLWATWCGP